MLPKAQHQPTSRSQNLIVATVAAQVSSKLLFPVMVVALRHASMVGAPMPEAPVDEDCDLLTAEHDVCFTAQPGERAHVLAVTQAGGM